MPLLEANNISSMETELKQKRTLRQGGIEPPARLHLEIGKAVFYH